MSDNNNKLDDVTFAAALVLAKVTQAHAGLVVEAEVAPSSVQVPMIEIGAKKGSKKKLLRRRRRRRRRSIGRNRRIHCN